MRGGTFIGGAWRGGSRGIAVEIGRLVVVVVRGAARSVLLGVALDLESLAVGDIDEAGGREAVGSVLGAAEGQATEELLVE